MIKIVAYMGDRSACSFYRVQSPLHALTDGNQSSEFNYTAKGVMEKVDLEPGRYDIAIFQRQYNPEVYSYMMEMKKNGCKIVYEVDDNLFDVPKWNPAHKFFAQKDIIESIELFVQSSDAVFVTQEWLKDVFGKHNNNIYILPNSVDFKVMSDPPNNSRLPVICWQGSNTHDKDLALIKKALTQLVKEDDCFVKLWSMDVPGAYKVPLVKFESFFPMFAQMDIDIGLAPLSPHKFNRSKSNLKFLEYSALKIPTVASDFGPYKDTIEDGETGFLVGNVADWYDTVRYLLDNVDERKRIGQAAYEFVCENYDIDKNCSLWGSAIKEILESK